MNESLASLPMSQAGAQEWSLGWALVDLLSHSTGWLMLTVVVLALLVGSFLNVVVHRLPRMLDRQWRAQAREVLDSPPLAEANLPERYTLWAPRSACPHCGMQITALQNVPVLSWGWLKGRCAHCRARISVRYPLVEACTALLAAVVAWRVGATPMLPAALVFTAWLIALTLIDADVHLLPDSMTLSLMWMGLLLSALAPKVLGVTMHDAIVGAALGYLSLWLTATLYKLLTKKEGMGQGDFKLLAALGAWMGWKAVPLIILLSSFTGSLWGLGLKIFRGRSLKLEIPYGPYLASAGWVALLWGDQLIAAYLKLVKLQH